MKTLTNTALEKLAQHYIDNLSHVIYDLDGVEQTIDFFSKKVVDNTAIAYVFFDLNYTGTINNIRVIDLDGDIVAEDKKIYERTNDKSLYIAFKHEFTEV